MIERSEAGTISLYMESFALVMLCDLNTQLANVSI